MRRTSKSLKFVIFLILWVLEGQIGIQSLLERNFSKFNHAQRSSVVKTSLNESHYLFFFFLLKQFHAGWSFCNFATNGIINSQSPTWEFDVINVVQIFSCVCRVYLSMCLCRFHVYVFACVRLVTFYYGIYLFRHPTSNPKIHGRSSKSI